MKRIIVGTDFSKHSLVAMRFAGLLAARSSTAMTVAHVANLERDYEGWRVLAEDARRHPAFAGAALRRGAGPGRRGGLPPGG